METFPRFPAMFSQNSPAWFKNLSVQIQKWFRTNWGMGSMIGMSMPASTLLNGTEIPTVVSIGAYLGFAVGAVSYTMQNWIEVKRYAPSTAIVLLAFTLIGFHGPTTWLSVLSFAPIFTTLTLLASVNIAPRLTTAMADLAAGFSAVIALGIRSQTQGFREPDVEEAEHSSQETVELQNSGYQGPGDLSFMTGHMQDRNPEPVADDAEDIELESISMSTAPSVRRLVHSCNSPHTQASQDIVVSAVSPIRDPNIFFPQAPEDNPLESLLSRTPSESRTDESSLIPMMSE